MSCSQPKIATIPPPVEEHIIQVGDTLCYIDAEQWVFLPSQGWVCPDSGEWILISQEMIYLGKCEAGKEYTRNIAIKLK